jgi:serine/threonine protein kinase
MSLTKTRKFCGLCGCLIDNDGLSACPNDGAELKIVNDDAMIGRILSQRYKILELIGTGGMGAVYRARHMLLDRDVAVKVLRMAIGDDEPERIRRFNQEGRVISAMHHNNIIGALDFGVDDGNVFLVMEYATGRSLAEDIAKNGRMSWSRALPIFIQICEALAYAHGKDIVHRDIKPSNVMLTTDEHGKETVKLLDFGVAKILNAQNAKYVPVTKTGIVFGSPPYMSPEQCTGHGPDPRSDIYSLGCVMYETLSGRTPITGDNSLEILHKQVIATPPDFSELSPAVKLPAGLEAIIKKALEKDIDARYQSMTEVRDDLTALVDDPKYVPEKRVVSVVPESPSGIMAYKLTFGVLLTLLLLFAVISPRSPLRLNLAMVAANRGITHDADEKAMREALVSLAKKLYKDGEGKEAQELLKHVIDENKTELAPNDPAMRDMRRLEAVLNKKNK